MADHKRRVLRVSGAQAAEFLQGLITNDVNGLKNGLVYSALLTPQGKYLADFFLAADGDAILIDVAEPLAAGLLQRLSMYKLRRPIEIEMTDLEVARGPGDAPEGAFADPRHPDMGWRAYDGRPDVPTDWDALRVAHLIPESGIELSGDTFILEAGFDRLNGVDFRKGCYVGQEVTARMRHKTTLRKGLARVTVEGVAPAETPITASDKPVGTLFSQADGAGIAYLRFDRAGTDMVAGEARVTYVPPDAPA